MSKKRAKIRLDDMLVGDRAAPKQVDLGHDITLEQPMRWRQVAPGRREKVPDGEPRIGIAIGDWAEGYEWFSLDEAAEIADVLAGAVNGARAASRTAEGNRSE